MLHSSISGPLDMKEIYFFGPGYTTSKLARRSRGRRFRTSYYRHNPSARRMGFSSSDKGQRKDKGDTQLFITAIAARPTHKSCRRLCLRIPKPWVSPFRPPPHNRHRRSPHAQVLSSTLLKKDKGDTQLFITAIAARPTHKSCRRLCLRIPKLWVSPFRPPKLWVSPFCPLSSTLLKNPQTLGVPLLPTVVDFA